MPHGEKYGPHYPNRYEAGQAHANSIGRDERGRFTSPTKYTKPFKYGKRLRQLGQSARKRGETLAEDFVRLGRLRKERGSWPAKGLSSLKRMK